ncbi:hypothetical protein ANANG_G00035030 [Anguilla anguilla]|uniref:Uncharacterized protein n=1 Tax=Anguilla anguilla TaxID=7936 RepID=A0A9D3S4A2_ANGAN|nr:hypothetical protein ANANG_G00035030 [Anguilla anguilla]
MKHRRNKGLPCLAWSRSDSSVHTQASAAVGTQPYPVDQATGLSQAAGPSCEPLHSQANVTNQKKKRKEAGGHEDVVCSVLGLQDQKSKNTPKAEGCDNVIYSIVALEDQKKKKRKEKNTQKAGGCEDVVYSTVNQKRMKKNTDEAEGGNDVVYSTLALEDQKKKKKEKNTEKAEGGNDVVYSTLALEDQKKEKKKKKKRRREEHCKWRRRRAVFHSQDWTKRATLAP